MTRNRRNPAFLLGLILFALAASACGDKEGQDALREVAKNLHRVGNATARADSLTYRLFLDGAIDAEEAEDISLVLKDINTAAADFQKKARAYEVFDENAKKDIIKLGELARDYTLNRITDGTLHIKNERVRQEWRAIINASYDAFASIVLVVRVAKPAPTPTPSPTAK